MRMWQSFGDASSMEQVSRPAAVRSRPRMLQGIKPEMMHKVLSSISVLQSQQQDDDNNKKKEINHNASSCKQFGGPKLLELFPERKSDEQQQQQKRVKFFSPDLQGKHGMCELLTIFYNGAVHVYAVAPDKAQEITDLANSILCKEESVCFNTDLKAATAAKETLQFAGGAPASESGERHKAPGILAQVRKQSLQRFLLQKRKDRLNSVAPFPVGRATAQIQSSKRRASSQEDQDLLKLSLVSPSHHDIVLTDSEESNTFCLQTTNTGFRLKLSE